MRLNSTNPADMSRRTTARHSRFASDPTYVKLGPTLTPISTASTTAGPDDATRGSSTRTAGRLFTTLDRTAATAANPSTARSVSPAASTSSIAVGRTVARPA